MPKKKLRRKREKRKKQPNALEEHMKCRRHLKGGVALKFALSGVSMRIPRLEAFCPCGCESRVGLKFIGGRVCEKVWLALKIQILQQGGGGGQ